MKTVLSLNGGINKDANPLYLKDGEVLLRKNARATSTRGGKEGINTSVKGMTQLIGLQTDGTNKFIGEVEDKERDQSLVFVYNSIGNHDIYKLSSSGLQSMGADGAALNFQPDEVIDADIIGDYCVFVSDYNPPRKINVTESLSSKDSYDIQLAVRPPSTKPTTVIGSDSTRVVNKLIGKTFQFATMYVYKDYTYSVLSPYSDIVVSSSVFAAEDNTYDNNNIGNYVLVGYDLGSSEVDTVKLLAREGNSGSWFVVEEYDKETDTGTRTVSFYNDVARKSLTETEALNLYSDVPLLGKTVKTVQNRVGLANVLKGYNKTNPTIDYVVEYENVTLTATSTSLVNSDDITGDTYYIEITIPSGIVINDNVSINLQGVFEETFGGNLVKQFSFSYSFSHTITQSDVDTGNVANQVAGLIAQDIVGKEDDIIYNISVDDGTLQFVQVDGQNNGGGVVQLLFTGSVDATNTNTSSYGGTFTHETLPSGVSTFKAGSYYNVGVLFYDEWSRTSGLLNPQKVYIPHAGERDYTNAYDRGRIAFTIPNGTTGVPSWAKYYRFAVTESVNFAGVYPFQTDTTDNIKEIFLDGKEVIAINMPTNLQYEFANGDYLQIEVDSGSAITNTITKTIIGTRLIIEDSGTEHEGFWLIVPKGSESIADYSDQLCYIYRTKDEVQDLVYFEDSNTYEVTSSTMQTLTGYVGGEDAWFVKRKFEWDTGSATPTVEDFYINVDDAIRAYSKGRIVVEFDTLGQIRLQDFVWSFNYLDNTKINGISTFNSLNREQLDEKDGVIQRIELAGYVIKVIQDNKETSLYIGKAQISDAAGNLQVVKSNDFIGTVNPSDNDYGSRFPLSVVQNNRNVFYWDGDNGKVIRSSPNGQIPISDYNMKSEFYRIKDANPSDVFAVFDEKNDEYVITFVIGGVPETWSFKDGANVWNAKWEYERNNLPHELYTNIGNQVYSLGFEYAWEHETNSSHNVFFGQYKPLSVSGVCNTNPREEKCFRAIEIDSNRALDTVIETPIAETRPLGQKTILYPATYRGRDGSYTSSILKNILTVSGEDINLLYKGNDIAGKYVKITFTDESTTECDLRLVTVNLTINN
jgi:hypothetical protein